jgi:methylase of polypeptide subunit release factors
MLEVTPPGKFRSLIRFSTIGELLFAHSSYPTSERDSVFFGPDTYRFACAISGLADRYPQFRPGTIVDVGTGSGAGGIFAKSLFQNASRVVLSDINPKALEFAQINAVLNDCEADFRQSDILKSVDAAPDLVISNPPYLIDAADRAYRHGGGDWGCALAERILDEALDRLSGEGHLLLYSGAPIVNGVDKFLEAVRPVLRQRVNKFRYEETDPDVFGEELESAPYDQADRIATVVLHVNAADISR